MAFVPNGFETPEISFLLPQRFMYQFALW